MCITVHISQKQNCNFIYHAIAIYVQATKIPSNAKCKPHAKIILCSPIGKYANIMSHINFLPSTI